MFTNVQFKMLSDQQMQLAQYRAQQMFLELKDEEKWNLFYGNKKQENRSHKEETQEDKVLTSDAAVQVQSSKPTSGSTSSLQKGQRSPHLIKQKQVIQNPKIPDENLSTVMEKLEHLESTVQDLKSNQSLNRNAVSIEPVIKREQCMPRRVSRKQQVVPNTDSNTRSFDIINEELEHILSTMLNFEPNQAQAMGNENRSVFKHAVSNYDNPSGSFYNEMVTDFNKTESEGFDFKNIQDTKTKHVSFQVPYVLKEAEMLEKRRASNLYPKRSSVRQTQSSKTSCLIKKFPSPASRKSIPSSVSNKQIISSAAASPLSNKRSIPSSISNKQNITSSVSNKQSTSSSPISSKRNISPSVSSKRNISSSVSRKQNIKSSVSGKQKVLSSSSVPCKQSNEKKSPSECTSENKSEERTEILTNNSEDQNVEATKSSHGAPELEIPEVIKNKAFNNEINLFAKKVVEIENTERIVQQRINILKSSVMKPVNTSYLTVTTSQEDAKNVQNTPANIKSSVLLKETKISHNESLQKEPEENVGSNGNNHYGTDEIDGKEIEINIDPSTLRSIHHYRKSYRRYLRQTSHEEVRGFSPWAVTNQICDLILDDCLREIALEVNKIPSSFVMDLYNEEFAQGPLEQP